MNLLIRFHVFKIIIITCDKFLFHQKQDFLGRVKNKAGDVEKILKEKDKHGLCQIYLFYEEKYDFFYSCFCFCIV